ncbi:MAG: 2,3-bisphosphoglycerate-independent phosphoglycerate mutase [Deltaproteobacteria bacterium]|nr:2,3-bisphosphoglycerate-independent phosphoglycerate mutase [Deltaproteobacteria bacterium]
MGRTPTLLCILDGFGLNPNPTANAVANAVKPTIDRLLSECPNATLLTHGNNVGLPDGHMGNSEVGHLNIGAGRVVEQWLYRIDKAFKNDFLKNCSKLDDLVAKVGSNTIHLIGLCSSGGVHSHINHLISLIKELDSREMKTALHLITDGRDSSPYGAMQTLDLLEKELANCSRTSIASVCGRFYAMDRDKRWERTEIAYNAIFSGDGPSFDSARSYIKESYESGTTDEFLLPAIINRQPIKAEDGIIFFNFRADRMRQIVSAITQASFDGFKREASAHSIKMTLSFTVYEPSFGIPNFFDVVKIDRNLGQVISDAGKTQLRTAETEKYPHVTYFFNSLVEEPFKGETRKLVPSPRDVKTYDLKPEMSADQVKEIVLQALDANEYDLLVVNFANCDMVGHTGVLEAAVKAVETVDACLGQILEKLAQKSGSALIIADHGNCEQMINYETGEKHTAHTTYPVPIILVGCDSKIKSGALCDVAPTILELMGIEKPVEMTGTSLLY